MMRFNKYTLFFFFFSGQPFLSHPLEHIIGVFFSVFLGMYMYINSR